LKTIAKAVARWGIDGLTAAMGATRAGRYAYERIIQNAMGSTRTVFHGSSKLVFSTPNALNLFRAETFSTKEPETLDWIDAMPRGSVVWDVGANVGLYACYAAKARGCRVFAFEPSVFNLELLARNVFLNDLTDLVTVVPIPLADSFAFGKFHMTSTLWGDALSTFGDDYGYDGKPLAKAFEYMMIGMSMRDAIDRLGIPTPDYVKMDVDGIEHKILKGGVDVLRSVRGVLVEINDDFRLQNEESTRWLSEAGLVLRKKKRWEQSAGGAFGAVYNQIWSRPEDKGPAAKREEH
jgi:FkbM family methyltransferase